MRWFGRNGNWQLPGGATVANVAILFGIPTCVFLSMSAFPADDREKRVLDVAAEWWRRRCAGDVIPEAELFQRYAELMPELAVRDALLRRLAMEAIDAGSGPTSSTQQSSFEDP